jgi:hypothetical protein
MNATGRATVSATGRATVNVTTPPLPPERSPERFWSEQPRPEPVRAEPPVPERVPTQPGPVPDPPTAELHFVARVAPPPTRPNGPGLDLTAPPREPAGASEPAFTQGSDPSTAWQEIDEPVRAPVYVSDHASRSRSAARTGRRRRRRGGRVFVIVLLVLTLLGAAAGVYVARFGPVDFLPGLVP